MTAGGACAGSQRKGKYAPVRMLASRMGATWLLRLQPRLIGDMLQAMRFESVCPANAGLLEAVLGSLRHECMESTGLPLTSCSRRQRFLVTRTCVPTMLVFIGMVFGRR